MNGGASEHAPTEGGGPPPPSPPPATLPPTTTTTTAPPCRYPPGHPLAWLEEEAEPEMSEARRRELLELGFPDDGYDYLRHMRTMGVGGASLEGVGGEAAGRGAAAPEPAAAAGARGGGGRCCMDHARGRVVRRGAERAGACGAAQSVLRGLRRSKGHAGLA